MYTAQASIYVDVNPQNTWDCVSSYGNLSAWMSDIETVETLSGQYSAKSRSTFASWKTITTVMNAPQYLAWESFEGDFRTTGFIHIQPDGTGSRITVNIECVVTVGMTGEVLKVTLNDPQKILEKNLEELSHRLSLISGDAMRQQKTRPLN